MFNLILRVFGADITVVALSIAGYAVFAWRQLRARLRRKEKNASPELFGDALLIAPAVYFLFCLVNLQAGPDLLGFACIKVADAALLLKNVVPALDGRGIFRGCGRLLR
jgi:hypothetical protein